MPTTISSNTNGFVEPPGSDGQVTVLAGVTVDGSLPTVLGVTLGYGLESLAPSSQIVNFGTIKSGLLFSGVDLVSGGAVLNDGEIDGGTDGITIESAAGTVSNTGTVTAATGAGIDLVDGGIVENAGTITSNGLLGTGLLGGVAVYLGGPGNNRLILDAGQHLNGVAFASGTNNTLELAVGAGATANAIADLGSTIRGFGTVQVDAGVAATIGDITRPEAVTLGAGASLTLAGGVVASVSVDLGAGSSTLNLLDPAQFAGQVLNLGAGDLLDIAGIGSTADVTYDAAAHAIDIHSAIGTTIIPVTFDAGLSPTALTLKTSSLPGGALALTVGSSLDGSATFDNPLGSNLVGTTDGHDLTATGVVATNEGSIRGQLGAGLALLAGGSVGNTGTLTGATGGVSVTGGTGAVSNQQGGQITATGPAGIGVNLAAGGSVANTGTLTGATGGVSVTGGTGAISNHAGGSITATGPAGIGVNLAAGGAVENAGTIAGTGLNGTLGGPGAIAVAFGAGNSRLTLDAGQVLNGGATATGSGNILELALGSGTNAITIADLGSTMVGFGTVQVDVGVAATIGQITSPEAVTLGAGASLALTGSVAASVTVDLGAGSSTLSLQDPGHFAGQLLNIGAGDLLDIAGVGSGAVAAYDAATHAIDILSGNGTTVVPVTFDASVSPTTLALTSSSPLSGSLQVAVGSSIDGSATFDNPLGSTIVGSLDGHDLTAAGVLATNEGSIRGQLGAGLALLSGGVVANTGVLTGATGGVTVAGGVGAVSNHAGGSITATGPAGIGVNLAAGGAVENAGTIAGTGLNGALGGSGAVAVAFGAGNSRLKLDAGQVLNGAAAAVGNGNVLELALGTGTNAVADLGTTIRGFGTVQVDAGVAATIGQITGPEAITLADAASLALGGPVASGTTIDLGGNGDTLTLGNPAGFAGRILNLGTDDTIDLAGIGSTATAVYNPNTGAIEVTTGGVLSAIIPVSLAAGIDPATARLTLASDGANGIDLKLGTGGTGTGGTGTGGTGTGGTGGTGTGGTGGTGTGGTGSGGTGTGGSGSGGSGGTSGSSPTLDGGSGTGSGAPAGGAGLPIPPTIGGTPTATSTPTVTGGAVPGSTVTLHDTDGTTVLGTATADPTTGAFSITSTPLADGLHSLTATDSVGGSTSAPSSAIQLDIDTHGPTLAFDTSIGWARLMKATLTGTVSDPSGVAAVEVYANGNDIGAADVHADGTWSIGYRGGRIHTTGISAVAVDGAGNFSSAASNYEIKAGLGGKPYTGILDRYDPATGAYVGSTFYKRDGDVVYQSSVETKPNGNVTYTYQGGDFFLFKDYSAFHDTYGVDGGILKHVQDNYDGSHTILGQADGQTITAIHDDTITGGGSNEQFVFRPNSGQELITDFQVGGQGHDVLNLVATPFRSLADVLSNTTMQGNDAVIQVNHHTSITLAGVSAADLKANPSDFKFHA